MTNRYSLWVSATVVGTAVFCLKLPLAGWADNWTPAQLSDLSKEQMLSAKKKFHLCVNDQLKTFDEPHVEARRATDHVINSCRSELEVIDDVLKQEGAPAAYSEKFSLRIRSNTARQILPMMIMRQTQHSGN